jgi:hypothetical protein
LKTQTIDYICEKELESNGFENQGLKRTKCDSSKTIFGATKMNNRLHFGTVLEKSSKTNIAGIP